MTDILGKAVDITAEMMTVLALQGECVVLCYNQAEVWKNRKDAKSFYLEAMCACEGCERDRYTDVLLDLMAGKRICHDGVTKYLTRNTAYR